MQQFVPAVSYFTLIDRYILSCMVFQFFMTLHNMLGGLIKNSAALRLFEWTSFGIAVFAFMLINVYFVYLSWVCIKKATKMEAKDKAIYEEACSRRKPTKEANDGHKENARDQVVPAKEKAFLEKVNDTEKNIEGGTVHMKISAKTVSNREENIERNSPQMKVTAYENEGSSTR